MSSPKYEQLPRLTNETLCFCFLVYLFIRQIISNCTDGRSTAALPNVLDGSCEHDKAKHKGRAPKTSTLIEMKSK